MAKLRHRERQEINIRGVEVADRPYDHDFRGARTLVRRQRLAALLYLRQVAPGEFATHLNEFINNYG